MKRYDKRILSNLTDRYERSKSSRRIYFTLTEKNLPAYFEITGTEYDLIHQQLFLLEEKGFVRLHWKGGRKGHILEKVELVPEAMTEIYRFLDRQPAAVQQSCVLRFMEGFERESGGCCEAVRECFSYIRQRLSEGKSVKRYVDFTAPERFYQVIRGVEAAYQWKKKNRECFLREFSMMVYGDSKVFEQLQGSILEICRDFGKENDTDFEYFGILKQPRTVLLKGCARVRIPGGEVNLQCLKQGVGIAGQDLNLLSFDSACLPAKVITVENLTAFYRFEEEDSLMIYLGGFAASAKVELLRKLKEICYDTVFYHFGDIDAGGIRIFLDLRRRTGIDFHPMHMGVQELKRYEKHARDLTAADRAALSVLQKALEAESEAGSLCKTDFHTLRKTVEEMLRTGKKLEQEIVVYQEAKMNLEKNPDKLQKNRQTSSEIGIKD